MNDLFWTESLFSHGTSFGNKFKNTNLTCGPILRGQVMREMGFEVSDTFYFLVCNTNRKADGFFGKLDFEEVLVPYRWNAQWIPEKVSEVINCLNSDDIPKSNIACKNCAYARQRGIVE